MDSSINKLSKILEHADKDFVQKTELKQFFDLVTEMMVGLKAHIEKNMDKKGKEISSVCYGYLSDIESKVNRAMSDKITTRELNLAVKDINSNIKKLKDSIPSMPDLTAIEDRLKQLEDETDVEITSEQIRDKLESIDEESNKLSIDAIQDLREELKELRKMVSLAKNITIFGGGGGGLGKLVKAYDLSPYLNGVLKTFTIPGNYRVISVHGSSFPFVFRPTTDYTYTTSSITFTSEVVASTMLPTGQSVIIIYAE
jgi:hypothetical protein